MKDYCTVDDVLSVAVRFINEVWPAASPYPDIVSHENNRKTIAREEVEYIVSEASEMVRAAIKPRYASDVIDAYEAVGYPPVIIYMTKTLGAILMYQRYAPLDRENNDKAIAALRPIMEQYQQIIVNGTLTDKYGDLVTRQEPIEIMLGRDNPYYESMEELKELYENGRLY